MWPGLFLQQKEMKSRSTKSCDQVYFYNKVKWNLDQTSHVTRFISTTNGNEILVKQVMWPGLFLQHREMKSRSNKSCDQFISTIKEMNSRSDRLYDPGLFLQQTEIKSRSNKTFLLFNYDGKDQNILLHTYTLCRITLLS